MGGAPVSSLVKKTEAGVDKTECHKFIKLCVSYLVEFTGTNWTDFQIIEASKQLYENYYFWTQFDWKHFISRVISGYYGKIYGALSPAILMEFAALHSEEWMQCSEGLMAHEIDLIKKSEDKIVDFTELITHQKENRIHQSALSDFKNKMLK